MDLLSRNGALVVGKQGGLDRYRLIAAFLVIAIHTSPLLSVNENADFFLTRIFARMAVPLFLMITGRYVAANFWENDPDEKGSSAAVLTPFFEKNCDFVWYFCRTVSSGGNVCRSLQTNHCDRNFSHAGI